MDEGVPCTCVVGGSKEIESRTNICVSYVGYSKSYRGGYVYNPMYKKVIVLKNVQFLEEDYKWDHGPRSNFALQK